MDGFKIRDESTEDYHFWIKGKYNNETNEFRFYVKVNPQLKNTDIGQFFEDLKQQLERKRTLEETRIMIEGMLNNHNERVQELGQIVNIAADRAWVEYFIESSLDYDIPGNTSS